MCAVEQIAVCRLGHKKMENVNYVTCSDPTEAGTMRIALTDWQLKFVDGYTHSQGSVLVRSEA